MRFILLAVLLSVSNLLTGQYNPDAGLVDSYLKKALIKVSSGKNGELIRDEKTTTYWESDNPLPSNYIQRKDLNVFSRHDLFSTSANIYDAIDGNLNTKTTVSAESLVIDFHKPEFIRFLSVKWQTDTKIVLQIFDESERLIVRKELKAEQNFQLIKFDIDRRVAKIILHGDKPFNLFEIAGLSDFPKEFVLVDFKEVKTVGQIWARTLNDKNLLKIEVFAGNTLSDWKKVLTIDPAAIPYIPYLIQPELKVRYLKIEFTLPLIDYYKVKLWELAVYDRYGMYGKPPEARKAENTYGESFGVNTVWGWGYNVYSDLLKNGQGPWKFNQLSSRVRVYHRLDWDLANPQQNADYDEMSKGAGTKVNHWLNWDREYALWRKAGFKIDACLMFNNDLFPDTLWKKPYQEAFVWGQQFSDHFIRKGLIDLVEIGNEPWEYDQTVYKKVLKGFSRGIHQLKDAVVLPCATQAYYKYSEMNNYIGDYLDAELMRLIDGLNTHVYNYIFDTHGLRKAVNPEDPRSEIWSVANLKRFLDKNLPGKEIYVTEFGYDSKGAGEDCSHPVCVSELEQAIYGVRSALILYRLGVKEFYWYYFANVAYQSFLHNRSGLTASSKHDFLNKLSFSAFEVLFKEIKNFRFEKIIKETDDLYAYSFINDQGKRLVVAWRPTAGNHNQHKWIAFSQKMQIKEIIPVVNDEKAAFQKNKIFISGIPVIIKLQ